MAITQTLIDTLQKELENCNLGPRQCGVNRIKGEAGYCSVRGEGIIVREMINRFEESFFNPSHQIYFPGCNLRCSYCTVEGWNLNVPEVGLRRQDVIKAINHAESKSLNLLGGEPAVNLLAILNLLFQVEYHNDIVWNSNMYYNEIVAEITSHFVDVYLADFKCWNEKCCCEILDAVDYRDVAMKNIKKALENKRVVMRHLIMPGHLDCCLEPIVRWIAEEIPEAEFSPRYNFVPFPERTNCPKGYLSQKERGLAEDIISRYQINVVG